METVPGTARGRPRDPAREAAILEAALHLVAELGYDRVSMDAVAAACGASKATLYRRWPSKAAMVAAALQCRHHDPLEVVDSGDVRQDLVDSLTQMASAIRGDDVDLLVGLLGAIRHDPELRRVFRDDMTAYKRAAAQAWTQRAIERELIPPGADFELVHEIGPALVLFRLLMTGEPVDDAFCIRLVDDVILPLLRLKPAGPIAADGCHGGDSAADRPERTPAS